MKNSFFWGKKGVLLHGFTYIFLWTYIYIYIYKNASEVRVIYDKKLKINENKRDNNTLNDCLCIS